MLEMAFGARKPIFHLFSWHRLTILRKFKAGVEKIKATVDMTEPRER